MIIVVNQRLSLSKYWSALRSKLCRSQSTYLQLKTGKSSSNIPKIRALIANQLRSARLDWQTAYLPLGTGPPWKVVW